MTPDREEERVNSWSRLCAVILVLAVAIAVADAKGKKKKDDDEASSGPFQAKTFQGLELRSLGPAFCRRFPR